MDDLFQQPQSDVFQSEFLPGRAIPPYEFNEIPGPLQHVRDFELTFFTRGDLTLPWITVIYNSQYFAQKASLALPKRGLKVYYPQTRYKEKEVQAVWDGIERKRATIKPPTFTPAYGRYLFIQLVHNPLFDESMITEKTLGGRFNENGVAEIISCDGKYSLTLNAEISENIIFHEQLIKKTDPKLNLRFKVGELCRVARGNLYGIYVSVCDDIFMYYKLSSKTEVVIKGSSARHYVKVGDLEKV